MRPTQTLLVDSDRGVQNEESRADVHRRAQQRVFDWTVDGVGFQCVDGTAPYFLDQRGRLADGGGVGHRWLRRREVGTVVSGCALCAGPVEPRERVAPGWWAAR